LPLVEAVKKFFPDREKFTGEKVKVLVPGCGLGRLVFEFAKEGFEVVGNEFSYYM